MKHNNSNAVEVLKLDDHAAVASRHGVFYPSGYSVAAFQEGTRADQVLKGIDQISDSTESRLLGPAAMLQLMDESVDSASLLAQIVSAELKQVEILRQFAQAGHSFVIFDRDRLGDEAFESVVVDAGPQHLVHYAMLAIENLMPGSDQMPEESPLGINERGRNG